VQLEDVDQDNVLREEVTQIYSVQWPEEGASVPVIEIAL
jgi:hypothetical protein